MLVYDITDGKSFDSIGKWLRNIDEVKIIYLYYKFKIQMISYILGMGLGLKTQTHNWIYLEPKGNCVI